MAGWFNIQQLKDPTAIQAVANGAGALGTALGAVTDKLGSIYNAERDRKYQMEQDRLKNERESAKNSAELGSISALEALRKAQEQKALSDMEQGILNGASLRGYRNNQIALGAQRNAETARNNAFNNGIARERLDYEQDGGLDGLDAEDFAKLRAAGVLNSDNSVLVNGKGYVSKNGKNLTIKQRNQATQWQNTTTKTAPKADKPNYN